MNEILQIKNLSKNYKSGERELSVLKDVNFSLITSSSCAVVGPSGSGKTTLLGLCAGLDRASEGTIILNGIALDNLSEDERAELRNLYVGFIFQNFNLMPTLTAIENVMVPLELRGEKNIEARALDLLGKVGLMERKNHYPSQLSGGEQQRVSIARAFSNRPKILFADEPTGNLDEETGAHIENLIFDLNKSEGTTLMLVTHDLGLAQKTERIIKMKGGKIIEDLKVNHTHN